MNIPLSLDEGVTKLIGEASPEQVALIRLTSSNSSCIITSMIDALSRRIKIPTSRMYDYTPPLSVSYRPDNTQDRVEVIPELRDPSLTYVIVDDVVYTGATLERAVQVIENQGVNPDNIWYFGGVRVDWQFDKAKTILEYALEELRKDAPT